MAGGLHNYNYTTDAGVVYAIKMDTSNANVAGNLPSGNGQDFLPRSIKARYGMYADQNNLRHRKVYAGTVALYLAMPPTVTLPDESGPVLFTLLYIRGEVARKSRSVNTGILP